MTSCSSIINNSLPLSATNYDEKKQWKHWHFDHPEFKRYFESAVVLGDKLLIFGGCNSEKNMPNQEYMLNLILVDPKDQTFKVITSVGDDVPFFQGEASACEWKDSKIIVFGAAEVSTPARVFILTLKDLDSEQPTAEWERVFTSSATQITRTSHQAHIYQNKMYIFGGHSNFKVDYNIYYLDLTTFTWKICIFPERERPEKKKSIFSNRESASPTFEFTELPIFDHEKVYLIDTETLCSSSHPNMTFYEINLENMTCKVLSAPGVGGAKGPIAYPQVIDRKIYALLDQGSDPENSKNRLWTFDLDTQKWNQMNITEYPAEMPVQPVLIFSNDQITLYGGWVNYAPVPGDFWSLTLNTPKSQPAQKITAIQQTMKQFLKEAPYSDISFEVESQVIPAHKWWLTQRSKYFMNMFSSGMLETQASKIKITDMKASTFKAFLEFLYSDHVELDTPLALELLQQSDKYSVADLKSVCETYLATAIAPENYVNIGQVAELVDAISLRQHIVDYVAKNMKKLKERNDFAEISDSLLRDSLVKFIVK